MQCMHIRGLRPHYLSMLALLDLLRFEFVTLGDTDPSPNKASIDIIYKHSIGHMM